tara:strand:+ start:116 stop:556 length:441 start_codon:yes stop_codon:yes gene_type:complete
MQYENVGKDYFIYIEKKEKVMDILTRFCIENRIKNGKVSGIGAVEKTEIGAFDTVKKTYIRKKIPSILELVSFEGNITLKDNQPFVHAHVVLSNHEMNTLGGHLFETTVAAVGEFFLRRFEGNVYRELNEDVGLPCICLDNKFNLQ